MEGSREDHLAFCKRRALEYVDAGLLDQAVASMGSDLLKHEDTRQLGGPVFMSAGLIAAMSHDAHALRRWILGFA